MATEYIGDECDPTVCEECGEALTADQIRGGDKVCFTCYLDREDEDDYEDDDEFD